MPADLLPTRFKPESWLLNKSDIVQWWKCALLFLCFYKFWRAIYRPLLTLLCLLLPHSAFYWVFFCLLVKRKGEQIRGKKKIPGSWRSWMWGACQSVLAQCGLMEFNWNPSSGKTGCSNGLCSSCIVKCLVIFMTGRLIWKDGIYEKYSTLWLQPCSLGIHTM